MDASNKMLLNAAKCQRYIFTISELLTENQQGGGAEVKLPPTPHHQDYTLYHPLNIAS